MSIQTKNYKSKRTGKTVKKYYAVIYDTKKKGYVWGKGHLLKRDAKQEEKDMMQRLETAEAEKQKCTFHEVAVQWMDSADGLYANATLENYKEYYHRQIKAHFADRVIQEIESVEIQEFINDMKKDHKPATVNRMITVLTNIFKYAVSPLHLVEKTPMAGIKRLKVDVKKKKTWEEEQIASFLSTDIVKQSPIYPMLQISFTLGARPGEVCGLAESDLTQGGLYFNRGIDKYGVLSDLKTTGSHRLAPIPEKLRRMIQKILQWKTAKKKRVPGWGDNDFMFVQQSGMPYTPDLYSKTFKRLLKASNIECDITLPDMPLYGGRHSFATNNIIDGENVKTVSEIMGNSEKTCLINYLQIKEDVKIKAIDKYSEKIL